MVIKTPDILPGEPGYVLKKKEVERKDSGEKRKRKPREG
jgi:hypothetical protein